MNVPTALPAQRSSEDLPVLRFEDGLPGFPHVREFVLVAAGEPEQGVFLLRSLDVEGLRFLVTAPAPFFPEYAPEIDDETAEWLGLTGPDDALLLVILTVGERAEEATANLLAPIIVNRHSRAAAQVVLADPAYSLRRRLVA